jgi:hypothetical protein
MARNDTIQSEMDDARNAGFDDGFADEGMGGQNLFDEEPGQLEDDGSDPPDAEYDDYNTADDEPGSWMGGRSAEARAEQGAGDEDYQDEEGGSEGDEVEWPEELLHVAGIDAATAAASYSSPQELAALVHQHDANLIQSAQWQQPQPIAPPVAPPIAPPVAPPVAPPQQELPPTLDQEIDLDKIIPEDWNDDSRDVLHQFGAQFKNALAARDKTIAAQQQAIQAQEQAVAAANHRSYVNEFDEFVEGLGDEYAGQFGRGSFEALSAASPNSMAVQNRIMLDNMANGLARALQTRGQTVPSSDELRIRALYAMFPQKQAQATERRVSQEVEQRQRQLTARPQGSPGKRLTGEARAIARLENLYDKSGWNVDDEIVDGL